jgi:hypothetical protein
MGYKNGEIYKKSISGFYNYSTYYKASVYNTVSDKKSFTLPNDCDYYYLGFSLGRKGTETVTVKVEKGTNDNPTYTPYAEQNAPLSLGNIEAYEDDEIQISYVQKAGYKKVTGANIVKKMGKKIYDGSEDEFWAEYTTNVYRTPKITSIRNCLCTHYKFNTTEYASQLSNNEFGIANAENANALIFKNTNIGSVSDFKLELANEPITVVYPLENPVITPITDQTFLSQVETLINMKTYKETTNIESTGADLAPVLDCDYYQDMSTLNDRLDTLEARIELLEN